MLENATENGTYGFVCLMIHKWLLMNNEKVLYCDELQCNEMLLFYRLQILIFCFTLQIANFPTIPRSLWVRIRVSHNISVSLNIRASANTCSCHSTTLCEKFINV